MEASRPVLGTRARVEHCSSGFPTPVRNVFTGFSPQFLASFIPTLAVAALVLLWQSSDRSYRELQPYISLARGDVTAAEGLLANYSGLGVYGIIETALKYQHYLIIFSTLTTLIGNFIQPLAGAIIQVKQLPQTNNEFSVHVVKSIGLVPDVTDLNAFQAAAGFAEAAVFHGLPDPPFVHNGWAIAEFEIPLNAGVNPILIMDTTAIQTTPNCIAGETTATTTPQNGNVSLIASTPSGCQASTIFDSASSAAQYGALTATNCGGPENTDEKALQPIAFWFYNKADNSAASVFCRPTIKALGVEATIRVNDNACVNVTANKDLSDSRSNNVTGAPLSSRAFNGVIFDPNPDTFVQARATAIRAGVSGAIFRLASQLGEVEARFAQPDGFLNLTQQVYTQHLSISAKSIYFLDDDVPTTQARLVSLVPRLWIAAIPAHILSAIFALVAFSALTIHIIHSRQRRRFYLAATPGSIAHIVSITAHARFGQKLFPYDDDRTLARKLAGLSFGLDPRTGAIVTEKPSYVVDSGVSSRDVTPFDLYAQSDAKQQRLLSTSSTSTSTTAKPGSEVEKYLSTKSGMKIDSELGYGTTYSDSNSADTSVPPAFSDADGSAVATEEMGLLSAEEQALTDASTSSGSTSFIVHNAEAQMLPTYSAGPNPPQFAPGKKR